MESEQLGLQMVPAGPEPLTLTGHSGKVWSVSWSPHPCNGADSMLASSGEDGSIIWQCHGSHWTILERLENKSRMSVTTCAWRSDGKVLAAGGCSSRVVLWEYKEDTNSFQCITEINGPWNQVIKTVSWNMNGEYLLFGTEDGVIFIAAKSHSSYETEHVERAQHDFMDITCGAWHPSKDQFVVSGFEKFKIYEAKTIQFNQQKTIVRELCTVSGPDFKIKGHLGRINAISYSNEGKIVSASANGKVFFWEFEEQMPVTRKDTINFAPKKLLPKLITTVDLSEPIICIDWSKCENDLDLVATGCFTNTVRIYSRRTSDKVPRKVGREAFSEIYAHDEPVNDVKWDPQKRSLLASASSDGKIKLWKVEDLIRKLSMSEPPQD